MNIVYCPVCNSQLQEGARFCPHCMTQFDKKIEIKNPKRKSNPVKIILFTIIPLILVIAILFTCFTINKHSPICTYDKFCEATPLVSQRMDIDDLWNCNKFLDTHYFKEQNITQYNTDLNIDNAVLSVFFYNKGEEIYAYISDINKDDYSNAESILKCIVQSACNHYFNDIDDVFDDESLYPKSTLDENFDTFFTDLLKRTDVYNNDIKNGTNITTRYIAMIYNNIRVIYYVIERDTNNKIIYDLAIDIERQS